MVERIRAKDLIRKRRHNPKGKPGQIEFEPTKDEREIVMLMVADGVRRETIAKVIDKRRGGIGIALSTLAKHFSHELECGLVEARTDMSRSIFRQGVGMEAVLDEKTGRVLMPAVPPNIVAAKHWDLTRGGQRYVERREVTDGEGKPLSLAPTVVLLPANGRETGAGGDPEETLRMQASEARPKQKGKANGRAA